MSQAAIATIELLLNFICITLLCVQFTSVQVPCVLCVILGALCDLKKLDTKCTTNHNDHKVFLQVTLKILITYTEAIQQLKLSLYVPPCFPFLLLQISCCIFFYKFRTCIQRFLNWY